MMISGELDVVDVVHWSYRRCILLCLYKVWVAELAMPAHN
jgi:hypothetical protein